MNQILKFCTEVLRPQKSMLHHDEYEKLSDEDYYHPDYIGL
jgi:hypothetical protein